MPQKTILVIGDAQRLHYQFLRDEIIEGSSPREFIENMYLQVTKEDNARIAREEGIFRTPENRHLFDGVTTEPVIERITADMFLFDDIPNPELPTDYGNGPMLGHQDMFSEGIVQANRLTDSMGEVYAIVIDRDVLDAYMTKFQDGCFGAHVLRNLARRAKEIKLFVRDGNTLTPMSADSEDINWEW